MDIIKLIDSNKEDIKYYHQHPAVDVSSADKLNYLKGLSLLITVDGKIDAKEQKYISDLFHTFDLPEEELKAFNKFQSKLDESDVSHIINGIKTCGMSKIFLIDCLILAYVDDEVAPQERSLIDKYFDLFEIKSSIKDQIYHAHNLLKDQADRWQHESLESLFNVLE